MADALIGLVVLGLPVFVIVGYIRAGRPRAMPALWRGDRRTNMTDDPKARPQVRSVAHGTADGPPPVDASITHGRTTPRPSRRQVLTPSDRAYLADTRRDVDDVRVSPPSSKTARRLVAAGLIEVRQVAVPRGPIEDIRWRVVVTYKGLDALARGEYDA